MAAADGPRLYSPEVLALATTLADFPLEANLPHRAEARSRTCGSTIALGMDIAPDGLIHRIGMQVSACAIGQASAALLAREAPGCSAAAILRTLESMERWLAGESALPDWPGFDLIAPAREHPARHGALLLPWTAASKALSSGAAAG